MGEKELGNSRLGRREHNGSRLGGRSLGAAGCNELRSSRLRRCELGDSSLGWKKLIDSKLGQRNFGGSRLRNLAQPQVVRHGFRIQRTKGARQLRVEAEGARRLLAED